MIKNEFHIYALRMRQSQDWLKPIGLLLTDLSMLASERYSCWAHFASCTSCDTLFENVGKS